VTVDLNGKGRLTLLCPHIDVIQYVPLLKIGSIDGINVTEREEWTFEQSVVDTVRK
jgi:hypothetical protein